MVRFKRRPVNPVRAARSGASMQPAHEPGTNVFMPKRHASAGTEMHMIATRLQAFTRIGAPQATALPITPWPGKLAQGVDQVHDQCAMDLGQITPTQHRLVRCCILFGPFTAMRADHGKSQSAVKGGSLGKRCNARLSKDAPLNGLNGAKHFTRPMHVACRAKARGGAEPFSACDSDQTRGRWRRRRRC